MCSCWFVGAFVADVLDVFIALHPPNPKNLLEFTDESYIHLIHDGFASSLSIICSLKAYITVGLNPNSTDTFVLFSVCTTTP